MAEIACSEVGEIAVRQGLQIEPRASRAQLQLALLAIRFERNLSPIRQFADDLIEDMRRKRGRASLANVRRQALGYLKIEIGRPEKQRLILGAQQDVRQNGIVLRRSTTRCTWPRDFNKAARSRVTFMGGPIAL